jgi:arginine decarboxylase
VDEQQLAAVHEAYGVERWGGGYFDVSGKGHILVRPQAGDSRYADLFEIVEHVTKDRRLSSPLIVRFPQILKNQLRLLATAFQTAISANEYKGKHCPVFPMKVNPRRELVEEFLRDTGRHTVGLECGSRPELYAAIAQDQHPDSLMLCNGFKDETFLRMTLLATQAGKRLIVVIENLTELETLLRLANESGVMPFVGLRSKLYARGSGKWASSGGDSAKFGLTTSELLQAVRVLELSGKLEYLKLLHSHIGSQITDIKRVKNAVRESSRVYAKLRQLGCPIEYLDVGGGLGVDYDGSKTRFESSMNYDVQEFANSIVYTMQVVCDEENVPHPSIVTESGRMMTAYHSALIINVCDEIETFADDEPEVTVDADDPQVIYELKDLCETINGKNFIEYYHDALEHKDELHTQFNLGLISLEDRAKGEVLFWETCARALKESEGAKRPLEEFEALKRILAVKYLCNFSLFRSAPDSWAIGQLFPIVPIHRLAEKTSEFATLVDVTCDSDGQIDKFVDLKDVRDVLPLHGLTNSPYYLGIFLVGAYQDVMGSHHNLFGLPDEAHVVIDEAGKFHVTKLIPGSRIGEMMQFAKYDKGQLLESYQKQLQRRVTAGELTADTARRLLTEYESYSHKGTYLD